MQTITLYRYKRPDGGTTVSPVEPDCEYTKAFRLVADDRKMLHHTGQNPTYCIDVDSPDGWVEVDEGADAFGELTETDYISELRRLGVDL